VIKRVKGECRLKGEYHGGYSLRSLRLRPPNRWHRHVKAPPTKHTCTNKMESEASEGAVDSPKVNSIKGQSYSKERTDLGRAFTVNTSVNMVYLRNQSSKLSFLFLTSHN